MTAKPCNLRWVRFRLLFASHTVPTVGRVGRDGAGSGRYRALQPSECYAVTIIPYNSGSLCRSGARRSQFDFLLSLSPPARRSQAELRARMAGRCC